MKYRRGNKLTDEQALAIFDSAGSCKAVGEAFGVSAVMVHFIRKGKRFRNLIDRERPEAAAKLPPADRWDNDLQMYV